MAKTKPAPQPSSADDSLANAHDLLGAWVAAADRRGYYLYSFRAANLESHRSGKALLAAAPAVQRRVLRAAAEQGQGWPENQTKQQLVAAVILYLLGRDLPLDQADCGALARYGAEVATNKPHEAPIPEIVAAIRRVVADSPVEAGLRAELDRLAGVLLAYHDRRFREIGGEIRRLGAVEGPTPLVADSPASSPSLPLPRPAPAGDPRVLVLLKRFLGIPLGVDESTPTTGEATRTGEDQFSLAPDSPLATEHGWLTEAIAATRHPRSGRAAPQLSETPIGTFLREQESATLGRVLLAAAERQIHALIGPQLPGDDQDLYWARERAFKLIAWLVGWPHTLDRAGTIDLLLFLEARYRHNFATIEAVIRDHVARFEALVGEASPTEGERFVLALVRATLVGAPPLGRGIEHVRSLTRLIGDNVTPFLAPGEHWSDAANADLSAEPPDRQVAWSALLEHALTASAPRPSSKWLAEARALVAALDGATVEPALGRWFGFVSRGRVVPLVRSQVFGGVSGDLMNEGNDTILKGLLWFMPALPHPENLVRAIGAVTQSSYRKVPGLGPRAVKVGNAAVAALAAIGSPAAVGQLALLKVKVKFGTAQKEIGKAFDAAAKALDLPRDEIEELGVPSYGLEEVGRQVETFGDVRAELVVTGTDVALRWFDAKGKALKSVPAATKRDHKDEVKELQDAAKDIAAMLPAQRDRIDGLFLLRRSWPVAAWLERYADHPLVGTIARRLIWCVDGRAALFHDGTPTDVAGVPVALKEDSQVTLWHPVECPTSEVLLWRERLEALGITQPFKQAHREVYLLTDAERRTATYSNRFAGHVVRQHQLNALAAARGWRSPLRVHSDYANDPATRELPGWDLRVEYWVEGIEHDWTTDRNDAGAYLRLATDQVRFYPPDAGGEPLPLEQIPPLVFSEVMRDVDLFVGVASVGNDPTWQDGGPDGRYRAYWQGYSFGELSGTATTRRAVLERLVPRLKIAQRCSFTDRFLRVEGSKRAYKIHLGSGNILMEPNDQYLCIVPDALARKQGTGDLFLPFEGDALLSVVLSKAFLLADDSKITDPTITRQIDGH